MIVKFMLMSTVELRTELHGFIEEADENFLQGIYQIFTAYRTKQDSIVGYRLDGSPVMAEVAIEEYAKRVEAMKAGQKTSIEDLRKEAAQW